MTDPRQLKYLNAMGIPVWVSRELVVEVNESIKRENEDVTGAVAGSANLKDGSPRVDSASSLIETLDGASAVPQRVTNQEKNSALSVAQNKQIEKPTQIIETLSSFDWQTLQEKVSSCQQCELHQNRTNTVFGSGSRQADWIIIGDAPASYDDQQGRPFSDQAGQLLTNMLRAIGLTRDEVYITNLLKCRPPNNRDPESSESVACNVYLQRQLVLLKPKMVLVVGRVAAQSLLNTKEPLARLRGKVQQLPNTDIPLVVTYHPAYLLKKTSDKRKAWDDLKLAKQEFDT